MKIFLTLIIGLVLSSNLTAQSTTRSDKLSRFRELSAELAGAANDLLLPEAGDIANASEQGAKAVRLMPREIFEKQLPAPQGGGSYFSFTTESHDYQKISQLGLEQNFLKSGFAGGNYGLMADLGTVELGSVSSQTPEALALKEHKPTNYTREYKFGELKFEGYVPAVVGHAYILRAVSSPEADATVAFKIVRKDIDGSLIIYWKPLAMVDRRDTAQVRVGQDR